MKNFTIEQTDNGIIVTITDVSSSGYVQQHAGQVYRRVVFQSLDAFIEWAHINLFPSGK